MRIFTSSKWTEEFTKTRYETDKEYRESYGLSDNVHFNTDAFEQYSTSRIQNLDGFSDIQCADSTIGSIKNDPTNSPKIKPVDDALTAALKPTDNFKKSKNKFDVLVKQFDLVRAGIPTKYTARALIVHVKELEEEMKKVIEAQYETDKIQLEQLFMDSAFKKNLTSAGLISREHQDQEAKTLKTKMLQKLDKSYKEHKKTLEDSTSKALTDLTQSIADDKAEHDIIVALYEHAKKNNSKELLDKINQVAEKNYKKEITKQYKAACQKFPDLEKVTTEPSDAQIQLANKELKSHNLPEIDFAPQSHTSASIGIRPSDPTIKKLRNVKLNDLRQDSGYLKNITGSKIKSTGSGFEFQIPLGINFPYHWNINQKLKTDLLFMIAASKLKGKGSVTIDISGLSEKEAQKVGRLAYESAIELGIAPDNINISLNGKLLKQNEICEKIFPRKEELYKTLNEQSKDIIERKKGSDQSVDPNNLTSQMKADLQTVKNTVEQLSTAYSPPPSPVI